jgi:hypothetical protein
MTRWSCARGRSSSVIALAVSAILAGSLGTAASPEPELTSGAASGAASPGWGPVQTLVSDAFVGQADVAVNPDGSATVVWVQSSNLGHSVMAADVVPGQSPSPVQIGGATGSNIEADLVLGSGGLQVGVDRQGNATVVWNEERRDAEGATVPGWANRIQSAYRPAGGTWTEPVRVSQAPVAHGFGPHLEVTPDGAAVVVWHPLRQRGLAAARRPPGEGPWLPPVLLDVARTYHAALGVNDHGGAIVVYDDDIGISSARFLRDGRQWTTPVRIDPDGPWADDGIWPDLAVNGPGDAVTVWHRQWGPHYPTIDQVESRMRPAGGIWQATEPISARSREDFQRPAVALDQRGRATVGWVQDQRKVQVRRSTRQGTWRRIVTVATGIRHPVHHPLSVQVEGNRRGDALVLWPTRRDGVGRLEATFRPVAGNWSLARRLTPDSARPGHSWAAAVKRSGGAYVTWVTGTDQLKIRELTVP